MNPKATNINAIIAKNRRSLDRLTGERVKIRFEPAKDLANAFIDGSQFDQVLLNLCVNARDAMPDGGKITVRTENAVLDERYAEAHPGVTPGRYVMLSVTDTGVGMDAELKKKVFEPFFTTKPIGAGTGLGLATVHGIVKQSRGHIWVYSEPGLGTTFKIYFPMTSEDAGEIERAEAAPGSFTGSENILLVEDEKLLRDAITRALRSYGYQVFAAATAEEARRAFAQQQIHLLLTDFILPDEGTDGGRLASELSNDAPQLKIVIMSGYSGGLSMDDAVKARATLMQKPISAKLLLKEVRKALD